MLRRPTPVSTNSMHAPNRRRAGPLLSLPCLATALSAQTLTLAPRVDFTNAQEAAQQAVCADFDQDGNLDIAVSMEGYNQGKVEILFGDGALDFGSTAEANSLYAWGLCAGDFDGDGWLDLAATSYGWSQHGIRLWRNDQQAGLAYMGLVSTLGTPPVGCVAADCNGDGVLDLVGISEGGGYAVDWFTGLGNGSFSAFHVVPNTLGLIGKRIYAGNFDNDGHVDLLAVHASGAMVLRNDPQGTGNFNSSGGIVANEAMASGAVADLDGDGLDDVVTAGSNLKVWRCLGNGQFTLLQSQSLGVGGLDTKLGDLDNDGVLDVLVVGYAGAQVFFGQGGGTFGAPQTIATGQYPKACVLGDFDGDGWLDLGIVCQGLAGNSSYTSIHRQVPPAVTATAVAFGAGCGSPVLSMAPVASGRPRLGQTGRTTITNAPTALTALAMGWSDVDAGGMPLPLSLTPFGITGCDQLQSSEVLGLPTTAQAGTTRAFALALPNAPALLGVVVHLQAYAFAPAANPAQLVLSNGVTWTIGNQ